MEVPLFVNVYAFVEASAKKAPDAVDKSIFVFAVLGLNGAVGVDEIVLATSEILKLLIYPVKYCAVQRGLLPPMVTNVFCMVMPDKEPVPAEAPLMYQVPVLPDLVNAI